MSLIIFDPVLEKYLYQEKDTQKDVSVNYKWIPVHQYGKYIYVNLLVNTETIVSVPHVFKCFLFNCRYLEVCKEYVEK